MYLVPLGDIHIGDKHCDYNLLQRNIDWIRDEPNAYTFLMGDILNTATRTSKSSPFEQDLTLQEQVEKAVELFTPIKDKIIGCISGNHEQRLSDLVGYDPLTAVCLALGVPYFGFSVALICNVGKTKKSIGYVGYMHHTTGGGATPGSKINRVNKLRSIVSNADFYCGGHNHALGVVPATTRTVDVIHKTIQVKKQYLIDCGGYLEWDESYAESKGLEPTKLGSPRMRLNGTRRDLHCSV